MRLIDADALIEIFEDRLEKLRTRYGNYSGESGVCAGAIHLVQEQPTIEPERWIPVTERLPDDVEIGEEYPTVIFCDSDGKVYVGFYEYGIYGNKWWNNTDWNDVVDDVLAWMPLPEPYKGGSE